MLSHSLLAGLSTSSFQRDRLPHMRMLQSDRKVVTEYAPSSLVLHHWEVYLKKDAVDRSYPNDNE